MSRALSKESHKKTLRRWEERVVRRLLRKDYDLDIIYGFQKIHGASWGRKFLANITNYMPATYAGKSG